MPLLDYANAQQSQTGLLNGVDPDTRQMIGFMLMRNMLGRRRSGGSGNNVLQFLMQMQQQQSQAERQSKQDAMEAAKFNLYQQAQSREEQKYQSALSEKQKEAEANKQLADMILKGDKGNEGMPQAPSPAPAKSLPPSADSASLPPPSSQLDSSMMVASNAPILPSPLMNNNDSQLQDKLKQSMNNQMPQQQQVQQEAGSPPTQPAILSKYEPDPQKVAQDEMKRRQMAAALIQAGKTKDALEYLQPQQTAVDKEMAKKDAESLGKNRESSNVAQDILSEVKDFKSILNDTTDAVVGPAISKFGMNEMFSSNAQKLNQIGSSLTLKARLLLQMPASGFSDADRDFLEKAVLNTKFDKDTLEHVAGKLETMARKSVVKNRFNEQYLKSHGSLQGADYEFFNYSDNLDKQAEEAIKLGKNPQKVREKLVELRGF